MFSCVSHEKVYIYKVNIVGKILYIVTHIYKFFKRLATKTLIILQGKKPFFFFDIVFSSQFCIRNGICFRSQNITRLFHTVYVHCFLQEQDNDIQDHDIPSIHVPNGCNVYLLMLYVTKTYSKKVEIYEILLIKSLFCAYQRECFHNSVSVLLFC